VPGVAQPCPALRQLRRRDSACFAHVLGATEREAILVCRESCAYGRALAMSAEVPATVLPEFVSLEVEYVHEEQPMVRVARVGLTPVELLGRLLEASRARPVENMRPSVSIPVSGGEDHVSPKTGLLHPCRPEDGRIKDFPTVPVTCAAVPTRRGPGRLCGSKNVPKPAPSTTPAPRVPAFLVVSALASAVASYPAQMKRARTSILRKRYNNAAGPGHKYHSYNDFLRDLNLAGVCVARDKYRVQDSWIMLDDAMRRLISTKQKRAA
jgi:hypothetical protein